MAMKKHSVKIAGHATSVTLEDAFWKQLKIIAAKKNLSISSLITEIDESRAPKTNLSSAIRLMILDFYIDQTGKNH